MTTSTSHEPKGWRPTAIPALPKGGDEVILARIDSDAINSAGLHLGLADVRATLSSVLDTLQRQGYLLSHLFLYHLWRAMTHHLTQVVGIRRNIHIANLVMTNVVNTAQIVLSLLAASFVQMTRLDPDIKPLFKGEPELDTVTKTVKPMSRAVGVSDLVLLPDTIPMLQFVLRHIDLLMHSTLLTLTKQTNEGQREVAV